MALQLLEELPGHWGWNCSLYGLSGTCDFFHPARRSTKWIFSGLSPGFVNDAKESWFGLMPFPSALKLGCESFTPLHISKLPGWYLLENTVIDDDLGRHDHNGYQH